MKYAIETRFTNDLGMTYERALELEGNKLTGKCMYIVRKDTSPNTFEVIEKEQYERALHMYKQDFKARLRAKSA